MEDYEISPDFTKSCKRKSAMQKIAAVKIKKHPQ